MSAHITSEQMSVRANRAAQEGIGSVAQCPGIDALMPRTDWSNIGVSDHIVQVYEQDVQLLDALHRFTSIRLTAGEAAVVIATRGWSARMARSSRS